MDDRIGNPYETLPDDAFWKSGVASKSMFDISGLWSPKFNLQPAHKVVTFGSCFAQNIGRSLRARGYDWHITEKAPFGLSAQNALKFNYELFSCRTANIYTASLLRQWVDWAIKGKSPPDEYWDHDGRCFDPFRPRIEPNGFRSRDEMLKSRGQTIAAFRAAVESANFFVFTLGLTESWFHRTGGYEYPMCPGTAAGTFDKSVHAFRNQQFEVILTNLHLAFTAMNEVNPNLRFILTVSPVPLTATNSGKHVLVATMESKSILRAVAGQMAANRKNVDYFPSYEIINSPVYRGMFFEPNLRVVSAMGVNHVMAAFFGGLTARFGPPRRRLAPTAVAPRKASADAVCEEELLEAFGPRA